MRIESCGGLPVGEEGGFGSVGVPSLESHGEGGIHFVDRPDAFERLGGCDAAELVEFESERNVVEEVASEDGCQLFRRQEGAEDDIGEEALGTMAAPDVLLATDIAAAEDGMILLEAAEEHCYLEFRERAEEGEVVES